MSDSPIDVTRIRAPLGIGVERVSDSPIDVMRSKLDAVRGAAERLRGWFAPAEPDSGDPATSPLPHEMLAAHAAVIDALLHGLRDESVAQALGFAPSTSTESSGLHVVRTIAHKALVPDFDLLDLGWRIERALGLLVGVTDADSAVALAEKIRDVLAGAGEAWSEHD